MTFAWIAAERAEFTVAECCRALDVAEWILSVPGTSGVCAPRPGRPAAAPDSASHSASRGRYGRRVWKDLQEAGERVSEKRVGRLMREEGLRARLRKRFRSTTISEHDQPADEAQLTACPRAARPYVPIEPMSRK